MTNAEYKELILDRADNYLKGPGVSIGLDEFTFQHPGVVFGPGPDTPRGYYMTEDYYLPAFASPAPKLTHEYDYLYVTDELISGRIEWENVPSIKVKWYTTDDIHIPWWHFWIDRCIIVNEKNTLLWQEAIAVAHAKKMPPVFPPLRYTCA